jgi:hypothetical protein
MQTDEHSIPITISTAKYALTNEIFHKGILFNVGDGYGKLKTANSKNLSGAPVVLYVSRIVPSGEDDSTNWDILEDRRSGELEFAYNIGHQ